jgi:hypothetical protein
VIISFYTHTHTHTHTQRTRIFWCICLPLFNYLKKKAVSVWRDWLEIELLSGKDPTLQGYRDRWRRGGEEEEEESSCFRNVVCVCKVKLLNKEKAVPSCLSLKHSEGWSLLSKITKCFCQRVEDGYTLESLRLLTAIYDVSAAT